MGREWILDLIGDFERQHDRGYLHIEAAAGLGKTALSVHLAGMLEAPAFFFNRSGGPTDPARCLNHLSAELIERFKLEDQVLSAASGQDSVKLREVMRAVATASESLWLVIDGLDEADPVAPGRNPASLPDDLPERVYVLISHRPGEFGMRVVPGVGQATIKITPTDYQHIRDVNNFLEKEISGPLVSFFEGSGRNEEQSLDELLHASEGNFMYLSYLFEQIRSSGSVDLHALPQGLTEWYAQTLKKTLASIDEDHSERPVFHLSVLAHLVVAQEAVSACWLAAHLGVSVVPVRRVLRAWSGLLVPEGPDADRWRILHSSFADYLQSIGEVKVQAAHHAIACFYRGQKDFDDEQRRYRQSHLSLHLRRAGLSAWLFELITDQAWRELQLSLDPSGLGYAADARQAQEAAIELDTAATSRDEPPPWLFAEVQSALALTEVGEYSSRFPPELVLRLVRTGDWTVGDARAIALRATRGWGDWSVLHELVPLLSPEELEEAVEEVLGADIMSPTQDIAAIIGRLPPDRRAGLAPQLYEIARQELDGDKSFWGAMELVEAVASFLPEELTRSLVDTALTCGLAELPDEHLVLTLERFSEVLPEQLPPDLSRRVLIHQDAASTTDRARMAGTLAPHLPDEARRTAVTAALAQVTDEPMSVRLAESLVRLAEIDADARAVVLEKAESWVASLDSPSERGAVLRQVAPIVGPVVSRALALGVLTSVAAENDVLERAHILVAVAPLLDDVDVEPRATAILDAVPVSSAAAAKAEVFSAIAPWLHPATRDVRSQAVIADLRTEAAAASGLQLIHLVAPVERVLPHLSAADREAVVGEALDLGLRHGSLGLGFVGGLRRFMSSEQRTLLAGRVLENAEREPSAASRATEVGKIALDLPDEAIRRALAATSVARDHVAVARAAGLLYPYAPTEGQRPVLDELMASYFSVADPAARVKIAAEAAAALPPTEQHRLIADALASVPTARGADEALLEIASILPDSLVEQALEAVRSMNVERRVESLAAIATGLTSSARVDVLSEASEALRVRTSKSLFGSSIADGLRSLSPLLTIEQYDEEASSVADTVAKRLRDSTWLFDEIVDNELGAVLALLHVLPSDARSHLADVAVTKVRKTLKPKYRAEWLVPLSRGLRRKKQDRVLREALALTEKYGLVLNNAAVLCAMLATSPVDPRLVDAAIAATAALPGDWATEHHLRAISHALRERGATDRVDELLQLSLSFTSPEMRVTALTHVIPLLKGQERARACSAACAASTEAERNWNLGHLMPLLTAEERAELLGDLLRKVGTSDYTYRHELRAVSRYLPSVRRAVLYAAWDRAMRSVGRRRGIIATLESLLPVVIAMSTSDTTFESHNENEQPPLA